jgi:hypothetical protein
MTKTYKTYLPEQDLLLPPSLRDWLPHSITTLPAEFRTAIEMLSLCTSKPILCRVPDYAEYAVPQMLLSLKNAVPA